MAIDLSLDVGKRLGTPVSAIPKEATSEIQGIIRDVAAELREFLLQVWPVETATSLQEWEIRGASFWLIIRNPLDYAVYVHRKGDSTEVWTEVQAKSEELVLAALPSMQSVIAKHPPKTQLEIPFFISADLITSALFEAKARAFQRGPTLTRDRIRNRIRDRIPAATPLGRTR